MNAIRSGWRTRLTSARADPMLANSALMFATMVLMATGGAVFWVVAARVAPPEQVGLAASLVQASEALALFAQLGLNITLLRTMPTSERRAADVTTAAVVVVTAGCLFALVYALLLPVTSPRLQEVVGSPVPVAIFCVLVAAMALNVLTDSMFLSINRVWDYLRLNGIMLGIVKCVLPFLLAGAGALGLYGSVGGAALLCGLASLAVVLRHVPGRRSLSPSRQLRAARRFAGAGYAAYVLGVVPQLVLPLLIINAQGAAAGAVFFVGAQVVSLLNAVVLAVGNSMYAESQRDPGRRLAVIRRGGITMAALASVGVAAVLVAAPYLLGVFGAHYAEEGTATLRLLSAGVLAVAFNYWSALRLRIAHHLVAMVGVQGTGTLLVVGLAALAAPHGTVWVALAWAGGQLGGGVLGYVVSRTLAHVEDEPVQAEDLPATARSGR